jgi:hypothetical protein
MVYPSPPPAMLSFVTTLYVASGSTSAVALPGLAAKARTRRAPAGLLGSKA